MQNDPSSLNGANSESSPPVPENDKPGDLPSSTSLNENLAAYPETEYREFASPNLPPASSSAPRFPIMPTQQSGPLPPYIPPPAPRVYNVPTDLQNSGRWQSLPPGYAPPPNPISQPGYAPPPSPISQPRYAPPPNPISQPGYAPPGPPRRRNNLALVSILLAVLVILAAVIGGIAFTQRGTAQVIPTPVACSGNCASPTAKSTSGPTTSAFQSAACPFQLGAGLVDGQQVNCGYVTVPENRSTNDGKTVKLAVAIFKAQQYMNTRDPDPVLRLDGGPGGPSLINWGVAITAQNYNSFVFDHDLVMFDQRGTGYSTPSLRCPALANLQFSPTDVSTKTEEQAAQTCYNNLTGMGIDLNGFNSIQNADDVADLIHALGYQQMTLYGVSYGTRLALTVMRLHPAVVHAVVLDSVYPTTHNRNDLPSDAQRVFDTLFQGCLKQASCNARYPNLQSVFYGLVGTLNSKPITINVTDPQTNNSYSVEFSGSDMVGWLFSMFYATPLIPDIPQIIYQVRAHDYSQLAETYGLVEFDDTFSDGMFYSTTCSEDWAFLTQQDITKSLQGISPQIAAVFGGDEQQEYAICQFWKVQPVPAAQKQPVLSSIPALVLSGDYDPITPPVDGQQVAHDLSHSYYFLFPGIGHGEEYNSVCVDSIISAFDDTPTQQPSGACIASMSDPNFQ
jgi:pimeloyl-ACP methyl ester carboxylesterase